MGRAKPKSHASILHYAMTRVGWEPHPNRMTYVRRSGNTFYEVPAEGFGDIEPTELKPEEVEPWMRDLK